MYARLSPIRKRPVGLLAAAEQWRKHFLQTGDEMVGFPCPLGQFFDLRILHSDLPTQEFILPFQECDKSRLVRTCRVMSRLVFRCDFRIIWKLGYGFPDATCRDRTRHDAARRRRNFLDVGNMFAERFRCDQILLAERGLDQPSFEMTFGAIPLDASGRPGVAGKSISL